MATRTYSLAELGLAALGGAVLGLAASEALAASRRRRMLCIEAGGGVEEMLASVPYPLVEKPAFITAQDAPAEENLHPSAPPTVAHDEPFSDTLVETPMRPAPVAVGTPAPEACRNAVEECLGIFAVLAWQWQVGIIAELASQCGRVRVGDAWYQSRPGAYQRYRPSGQRWVDFWSALAWHRRRDYNNTDPAERAQWCRRFPATMRALALACDLGRDAVPRTGPDSVARELDALCFTQTFCRLVRETIRPRRDDDCVGGGGGAGGTSGGGRDEAPWGDPPPSGPDHGHGDDHDD